MVGSTILILCTVDSFDRGAGGGLLVGLFRATRIGSGTEILDEPVENFEEDVMEENFVEENVMEELVKREEAVIADVDSFEGEVVMSDIGSHVGLVLFIG